MLKRKTKISSCKIYEQKFTESKTNQENRMRAFI